MIDATTLQVMAVIFFATLIRSSFGFGEALIAVPLLSLRLPVAVDCALGRGRFGGDRRDHRGPRLAEDRDAYAAGLVLSAMFGIPLGLLLITRG